MKASRCDVVMNPKYAGAETLRRFIEGLPDTFDRVGRLVFRKRNTVRVVDDNFGFGSLSGLAVKRFKDPGWLRGLYYTYLGKTKAFRAYHNALELLARGADTPEPIAYIEVRRHGLRRVGFVITGKTTLPTVKEDLYHEDRFNEEVGEAFAAFVARLHSKGILHRDLNCDNVLVDKSGAAMKFTLIDVNRMNFVDAAEAMSRKVRMRNLCLFTRSETNVRRVARSYARHAGMAPGFADETARYKRRFNARRRRRKRFTRLFKKRRNMP